MAKKYHPDKVNDLGEDVKKSATEKFRSVNEAYENLKKQRGIAWKKEQEVRGKE